MRKLLVSEPSLTNFEEFAKLAKETWESGILTHNGPKVQELERRLKEKWEIPHLSLVTNGTIALEIAIRALKLPKGSGIITTPFTWVATASSILWQNYKPIFVDIDPETLNIDPEKIDDYFVNEYHNSDIEVSAILAVHVFSNPCEVEIIDDLAKKYRLKVIYDGAHSVNVKYKGRDLSQWGDITTHSYHATKLYNSGEGGAIITSDEDLAKRIERLRFFGHDENKDIVHEGTNGKMHEISACMGLANLEMMDKSMLHRKMLTIFYKERLANTGLKFQRLANQFAYNYSYCPIIFDSEETVLKVMSALEADNVIARRYFYPSVNEFKPYSGDSCPISEDISRRIICVPCHDGATVLDVDRICKIIRSVIN